MWVRDAVQGKRLPSVRQLQDPRWFPYRFGHALWVFLAETYGEDVVARALASNAGGGAIGRLTAVTGEPESRLTERWHEAMRAWAGGGRADPCRPEPPAAACSAQSGSASALLVDETRGGGKLNVGPALSPDGSLVAFFSERDRYSVDLFLADARTGAIRRKIVSTAGNARFDSLQFIDSAGAWDAQGTRFAFAALRHGQPILTVLRMPSGDVEWTHTFSDVDQIFDPTWSPDGRRLAFAALRGGATDLHVFDIEAASLRRLTRDAYADLQPAWSPDGRMLAFTTDRFTSSLDSLLFGAYRLAVLDLETGDVRELPSIEGAKNIDPQWVGSSLVFIADAGGVSNVYRADPIAGTVHQLTHEETGVSGVTALSPALSVAPAAGQLAYTVYTNGGFQIRTHPLHKGTSIAARLARAEPHAAPARERRPAVASAASSVAIGEYRGRLALNGIGQPYLSAGGGALGGFFRAGVSLSFSDLLEQQQLQTAVQVGTRAQDFAVQTAYVNRQSRWSWGVLAAQLPVGIAGTRRYDGGAAIVRETETYRQTHRQALMLGTYPFSRVRRLELTSGLHAVGFSRELLTRQYHRTSGALVAEDRERLAGPRGVVLFESAAALVYDSSVAGPTAPVLGRRSRFEISPTVGDLSFVTVTTDFRRYHMPVRPVTVAWRLHHVGRYGPDAGDGRLLPLVWTLRDLVRGYAMRDALGPACANACDWIANGGVSRVFAANLEVRAPLIGPLGLLRQSGFAPIDAFVFADAGLFGHPARSSSGMLRAAGAGVRVNATGFIFEFAAARPFDRDRSGWTLAMNFRPGF
jgi:hypothetical protein